MFLQHLQKLNVKPDLKGLDEYVSCTTSSRNFLLANVSGVSGCLAVFFVKKNGLWVCRHFIRESATAELWKLETKIWLVKRVKIELGLVSWRLMLRKEHKKVIWSQSKLRQIRRNLSTLLWKWKITHKYIISSHLQVFGLDEVFLHVSQILTILIE